MIKNGYQKYAKTKRENASPLEQVAILLDHGANLMTKAHAALLENRIEDRFIAIDKTLLLLNGLMSTLAPDPCPKTQPLSQTMSSFYHRLFQLIMQVNVNQDASLCQTVIQHLRDMAQLWRDVDKDSAPTGSTSPLPSSFYG